MSRHIIPSQLTPSNFSVDAGKLPPKHAESVVKVGVPLVFVRQNRISWFGLEIACLHLQSLTGGEQLGFHSAAS